MLVHDLSDVSSGVSGGDAMSSQSATLKKKRVPANKTSSGLQNDRQEAAQSMRSFSGRQERQLRCFTAHVGPDRHHCGSGPSRLRPQPEKKTGTFTHANCCKRWFLWVSCAGSPFHSFTLCCTAHAWTRDFGNETSSATSDTLTQEQKQHNVNNIPS